MLRYGRHRQQGRYLTRLLPTYQEGQQTLLASKSYQKAKKLWDKNKEVEEEKREIFFTSFDKIIYSMFTPISP
jgi:hypothetical protein